MKTHTEIRALVAKSATTTKEVIHRLMPDQSNPTCSQIVGAIQKLCKTPNKIQDLESIAEKVDESITSLQELTVVWNRLKSTHHDFAWYQITSKYEVYLSIFQGLGCLFKSNDKDSSSSDLEGIVSQISQDISVIHNRYSCLEEGDSCLEEGGDSFERPIKSSIDPPCVQSTNTGRKDNILGSTSSTEPDFSVSQLDESSLVFDLIVEYVEATSFFSKLVRNSSKKNGNHLVGLAIRKCW